MQVAAKVILAKEMLSLGFYSRIISQETMLSKKVVVKLAKRALDAGDLLNYIHRPGREPTGAAIIKNIPSKIHASVVTSIYSAINRECIGDVFYFKAVRTSFRLYVKALSKTRHNPLLYVNDVWYLIKELREKTATMETCYKCYLQYFQSINQRMNVDCPFCFNSGIKSKEDAEAEGLKVCY